MQSESKLRISERSKSIGRKPNENSSAPAHAERKANRIADSGKENRMGDNGEVNRVGDSGLERVGDSGLERVDDGDERDGDERGDDESGDEENWRFEEGKYSRGLQRALCADVGVYACAVGGTTGKARARRGGVTFCIDEASGIVLL